MKSRSAILFSSLSLLTAALFVADLAVGSVNIPPHEVWAALTGGACDPVTAKIVLDIRLMKAVVALLAGMSLASSALLLPSAVTWQTRVSPIRSVRSRLMLLSIPAEWNTIASSRFCFAW